MKINISQKQWESIGTKTGWLKSTAKISHCCNAKDMPLLYNQGPLTQFYSDLNVCPNCKQYCKFVII